MHTREFAIVSIRVLGVAAISVGVICVGTACIMRTLGSPLLTNTSIPDLALHDTYYVISHIGDGWFAPGAVSLVTGIVLLITSRRLGALLMRGIDTEG